MTAFHKYNALHLLLAKLRWSGIEQDPTPSLQPPSIPNAEANGGIGYKDIVETSDPLTLLVPPYGQIKVFDRIDVFWDGFPVATKLVSPEDLLVPGIIIPVPVDAITDGTAVVHYLVTSSVGGNRYKSYPLNIRVKTDVPGGIDPDPLTSINENLEPVTGVPAEVDENNIENIEAVIPVYFNMTKGDRVRLSWGREFVTHTVEDHEVGHALKVPIPASIIERVGVGIKVIDYEIRDVVTNWSKWSKQFDVNVMYAGNLLDAPIALDVVDSKLDLARLGSADARVNALDDSMLSGETVRLSWTIYPVTGDPIEHAYVEKVVAPGTAVEFSVPNAIAIASAKSRVTVKYELVSNTATKYSRSSTFDVIPEVEEFVPPVIVEAPGYELDLGKIPEVGVTAQVPVWVRMAVNDWVELYVYGFDANDELSTHYQGVFLSSGQVGHTVEFLIPRAFFNQLSNGRVDFHYSVNGVDSYVRDLKVIGQPVAPLAAPSLTDAVDGELDPDKLTAGTTVVVGDYERKAKGDKVTLLWEGLPGASWSEEKEVTDPAAAMVFDIDYDPYIIGNLNRIVTVSYRVQRAGGGGGSSETVPIQVRRKGGEEFAAPTVVQAEPDGTTLEPYKVINGATVHVAFAMMSEKDSIRVVFSGTSEAASFISEPKSGSKDGYVEFTVPAPVIGASQNTTVEINYSVMRDNKPYLSDALELKVTNLLDSHFVPPEVPDSREGVLYPSFGVNPRVTQQRWPLIGAFQLYWIKVEGTGIDGTPRQFYAANARPVTVEEATKGLSVAMAIDTLLTLKNRSELKITVKVAFDRNSDESKARSLPPLTLELRTPFLPPIVEKATGPDLNQLDMKDFITAEQVKVTVPIYREMASGDTVDISVRHPGLEYYISDSQKVVEPGLLEFNFPRRYLLSSIGNAVGISYAVMQESGQFDRTREKYFIVASQSLELKAAEYLRATQQVSVSYDGQKAGHTVQVRWDGVKVRYSDFKPVSSGAPTQFVMDRLWITENIGKKVVVNYTVNSGDDEFIFSKLMVVQF